VRDDRKAVTLVGPPVARAERRTIAPGTTNLGWTLPVRVFSSITTGFRAE